MKILSISRHIKHKFSHTIRAASLLLILLCGSHAQAQLLDQVVAIVDDDVVLASEMKERVQQLLVNINKSGQPSPPMEEIQRKVLDQLVLESIQMQMANRAGVRISDSQLNEALTRIANQNNMDLMQFKAALEADGLSYSATREQIRKEMILSRVQQGNVNQRVQITDQEIDNFLDSEEGSAQTAPEYHMLHTLVPIASGASNDDIAAARKYANALYDRIQSGAAYEQVLSGSTQPYPLSINDLGWRKASDLPGLLTDLGETLKPGQTAPPIQSASGFHLVKMLESRGKDEVIPQTRARHILLKPSAIRDDAATKKQITEIRQRILKGEDFGDLARQYSEDIGSALEGGNLDWTSPGQMVEAFQQAMDNTKVNEISPPARSQFGWHIVQVLERRQKDVTTEIRRNIAHNYIHQHKYDDELQAWLQKIRDEAYVDFK